MHCHRTDGRGSINEILRILRNDLRKEMGLSLTDGVRLFSASSVGST